MYNTQLKNDVGKWLITYGYLTAMDAVPVTEKDSFGIVPLHLEYMQ
jgi:hypothetical protein